MSIQNRSAADGGDAEPARESEWAQIRDALRGLRYGNVSIIVQDGVVIQIDRTEKRRLRRSAAGADTQSAAGH